MRAPLPRPDPTQPDETQDKKAQGARLAEARAKFHDTASEAAKALGVSVPTYCAHENGGRQIRPHMASYYAKHFNTTPEHILYGSNAGPTPLTLLNGKSAATPPPTHPSPPVRPARGLGARLLEAVRAQRDAQGRIFALPGDDAAVAAPRAQDVDGVVPELAAPSRSAGERRLIVGRALHAPGAKPIELALVGFLVLPPELSQHERMCVLRLRGPALPPLLAAGQRVLVDLDDLDLSKGGLFIVQERNGQLAPVLARPGGDGRTLLHFSKWGAPMPYDPGADGDCEPVGRATLLLAPLNDEWLERMFSALPATA